MMVAAVVVRRELALAVDRAAEFAAPDDQRVVEQAALLQVLRSSAADAWSVSRHCAGDLLAARFAVLVPAAVEELDEAHAALGQPAGQQAVGRERAGLLRVRAVQLEDVLAAPSRGRSVPAPRSACGKAISYCAMRVAISGSPNSSSFNLIESAPGRRASGAA